MFLYSIQCRNFGALPPLILVIVEESINFEEIVCTENQWCYPYLNMMRSTSQLIDYAYSSGELENGSTDFGSV